MHSKLAGITRRPELVILYAGHNEFQSRFDWAHGGPITPTKSRPDPETLRTFAAAYLPCCD